MCSCAISMQRMWLCYWGCLGLALTPSETDAGPGAPCKCLQQQLTTQGLFCREKGVARLGSAETSLPTPVRNSNQVHSLLLTY